MSSTDSPFRDVAEIIYSELDRIEREAGQWGVIHQNPDAETSYAVNEITGLLEGALKVRSNLATSTFDSHPLSNGSTRHRVGFVVLVSVMGTLCMH